MTSHLPVMETRRPPTIDMTPDGRFIAPPSAFQPGWPVKLGAMAFVIAIGAGALAMAVLLLWLAMWLIPVALVAGGISYAAFRYQLWRARSGRASRSLHRF